MSVQQAVPRGVLGVAGALALVLATGCAGGASAPAEAPEPEQVQIGYGSVAARNLTGSVASITERDIARRRVFTIEELFQGVPGVRVLRTGGRVSLQIRGATSLVGSNEPLVVIDGVPIPPSHFVSAFSGIVPEQVARIDVIKDATAAMYGSRGANGVILITTKGTR